MPRLLDENGSLERIARVKRATSLLSKPGASKNMRENIGAFDRAFVQRTEYHKTLHILFILSKLIYWRRSIRREIF